MSIFSSTNRHQSWFYGLLAIVLQTTLAAVTNLHKMQRHVPGTPTRVEDTDLYYRYATWIWTGNVPYRDFLVEYPPLALPVFLIPRVFSATLAGYKLGFAVEMLTCNAICVWAVAWWVEKREGIESVAARLAWYTVFFLMMSRFLVSRYDAAPMLAGFGAAVSWSAGRGAVGGLIAGIGTLMKFYPALITVPPGLRDLAGPSKVAGRGAIVFLGVLAVGVAGWLAFDGVGGVARSVGYHVGRGFEYGSLYAGVQMLTAKIVGAEIVVARDHASYSSLTRWSPFLLRLAVPVQLGAVVAVYLTFVRRGRNEAVRYGGAAVLAFVVTGKVFSPQFLIWLMPFITVVEGRCGRQARWLFAAGCLATLLAPSGTPYFPRTSLWVIIPYNVKNALFCWLLTTLLFGPPAEEAKERMAS